MTASGPYTRPAVDHPRRATCPCCLKDHEIKRGGRMIRHGWNESGRRVGEYGQGFQWGNCHGWSLRPLEETDTDALAIIDRIDREIARTEARFAVVEAPDFDEEFRHTSTHRAYQWPPRRVRETEALRVAVREALPDVKITEGAVLRGRGRGTPEPSITFEVEIVQGFQGIEIETGDLPGCFGREVIFRAPSWDKRRAQILADLRATVNGLFRARRAIEEAIEYHRANPSRGFPSESTRETLHFRYPSARSVACGSRGHSPAEAPADEVTCSRCLKAIEKGAAARAAGEANRGLRIAIIRLCSAEGPRTAKQIKVALRCDQKALNRATESHGRISKVTFLGEELRQDFYSSPAAWFAGPARNPEGA